MRRRKIGRVSDDSLIKAVSSIGKLAAVVANNNIEQENQKKAEILKEKLKQMPLRQRAVYIALAQSSMSEEEKEVAKNFLLADEVSIKLKQTQKSEEQGIAICKACGAPCQGKICEYCGTKVR